MNFTHFIQHRLNLTFVQNGVLYTRVLLIIAGSLLLQACGSQFKPATSGRAGKSYQSYFVGDGVLQYFIKPLTFSQIGAEPLTLDITYRRDTTYLPDAILNFTLLSRRTVNTLDTLYINLTHTQIALPTNLAWTESTNKGLHESRFTSALTVTQLELLLNDHNWKLQAANSKFFPTKKTRKSLISIVRAL